MGADSKIEWTDHTFNPWIGCTKVSPGCAHCYAETTAKFRGWAKWGPGQKRQRTSVANWRKPLQWNKAAKAYPDQCTKCGGRLCMEAQVGIGNLTCPSRRDAKGVFHSSLPACGGIVARDVRPRVFCASLADVLDPEVPVEWRANLLELVHATPNLVWLLLTKRPGNWQAMVTEVFQFAMDHGDPENDRQMKFCDWVGGWVHAHVAPANVWMGTTVEDQVRADERVPQLLFIPAKVRFLSCEPLLGPVDLEGMCIFPDGTLGQYWPLKGEYVTDGMNEPRFHEKNERIHWVIAGGESGGGARPMRAEWARSLRDQCAAAGVRFFFKQWGEHDAAGVRVGKKAAGRVLDGCTWEEVPIL